MEYAWGVFQLAKRYFKIQSLSVSSPAHQFNCIRTQGYLQLIGFSDQRLVLFLLVYLKLNRQVPAARIFILSFLPSLACSSFLKFLCSPCIFPHPSHSLSLSLCAHSFILSAINLPFQHYFFHFPPRSFFHLCLLYSLIGFQYNINPLKSLRDLNS